MPRTDVSFPATPPPLPAPAALRLRWMLRDLPTADAHRLTAHFSATVRPLPDAADRQLFAETFGTGSPQADPSAIVAHFAPALTAAAAAHASKLNAALAIAADAAAAWIATLRTAADAVAFACGVELLAPFSIDLASPTLQQEQIEQMQQLASERRSADRLERLEQGAELLKRWEQLRAAAPSLSPGRVLGQLDASDQGTMLETLLLASASAATQAGPADLWAVAGPFLVRIEHGGLPSPGAPDAGQPTLTALPTTLGPLRSVAAADGRLLIGARQGVLAVDRANLSSIETYADPYLQSEHGFSNVAAAGEQIWAIHSDGGVVTWRLGTGERPACVLRPAQLGGQRPRQLLVLGDNRILIAAGNQLLLLESDQAPQPMDELASPVVALLLCDDRLAIASEDGTISVRDPRTLAPISRFQPTGRIAAAAAMPWLGSARLLLASCDGPIFSIGLEDQLVMQYSGVTGSVRAIAATAGKVAAMTADRQRVVIWNAWNGRAPAAQIQLSTVARHRVADLAFA